ncbi:MAG TPA: PqqD family protein [Candidatus Omnitrophota bacterium]|nr:PqqD family protein [Candidatus Omnitrophota bacterium]HQQ06463.1 PqqD family protein [Candidatus Omnitrophota bacterium]
MQPTVSLTQVYKQSRDVVARDVQGEFIIVPVASGIAEEEDEIYSLNETGRAVWEKLNGKKSLKQVIKDLAAEYSGSQDEIKKDVLGIVQELVERKMLVKAAKK